MAAAMEYVTSADGRTIAYERSGSGPPVVLVHGSLNDRNIWRAVLPAFAEQYSVYAMDRRGRGESGPPGEHALERQFEDVAAVIEAAGEPADLVGHSYGAHCALGAAAMVPDKVRHLVLYEPPLVDEARVDMVRFFETSDPSQSVSEFFLTAIGMPHDQVEALKATAFWPYLVSFAPTMPSEGRALLGYEFEPGRFASLKMPALFLAGSQTTERLCGAMRELMPYMLQSEWVTFEGHGHGAMLTAPAVFSDTVLGFLAR
jgi:pimeloyl-ACP methyl ester carboxylesterase